MPLDKFGYIHIFFFKLLEMLSKIRKKKNCCGSVVILVFCKSKDLSRWVAIFALVVTLFSSVYTLTGVKFSFALRSHKIHSIVVNM